MRRTPCAIWATTRVPPGCRSTLGAYLRRCVYEQLSCRVWFLPCQGQDVWRERLAHHGAAIHVECLSGHEPRPIGGEEKNGASNILGGCDAAQRCLRDEGMFQVFFDRAAGIRWIDETGTDRVGTYSQGT